MKQAYCLSSAYDEEEVTEYIQEEKCYEELASTFNINITLIFFKINKMYRMGYPINQLDISCKSELFTDIDSSDETNHEKYCFPDE